MIVWSAQNAFADEMLEADKREYTKKKLSHQESINDMEEYVVLHHKLFENRKNDLQ